MSPTRRRAAAKESAPTDLLPPYMYVLDPDNPSGLRRYVSGESPEGVEDCKRRRPPDEVLAFIHELENVGVEEPMPYPAVSGSAFPSSDGPRNLRPAASCVINRYEEVGSEKMGSVSEHQTWEGASETAAEPAEDDGSSEAGADDAEADWSDQSSDDDDDDEESNVESFRERLGRWFADHPSANVSIADVSDTAAGELYFGSRSRRQRWKYRRWKAKWRLRRCGKVVFGYIRREIQAMGRRVCSELE
ncbi:hypothetical protein FQN50_005342 [Emmonsiellopsis sp. PD_5]|nr:hypothetical protein FQN50_005342 [Emmonsiellopsis sp. PD_5]